MSKDIKQWRSFQRQRGFTLIEIMVVVIIIGILAAIVAPNVIGRVDDAQITKAKAEISNIENALKFYRLDNFSTRVPSRVWKRLSPSLLIRRSPTGSPAAISTGFPKTHGGILTST